MVFKINEAVNYINKRIAKRHYNNVLSKFSTYSKTYWFVKDVVRDNIVEEQRVRNYGDLYAAIYLRDMIVHLFDVSKEKANHIVWG